VIGTVFRLRPVEPVEGRTVALFTTAPEAVHDRLRATLEREHGARVTLVSGNLARRDALRADLERAGDADAFLVEIKAAAIDVVAEAAAERGVETVFCDNTVEPLPGGPGLDEALTALADAAARTGAAA
jgi:cyclic 2,3-diphosphoglycerate synthetase